MKREKKKRQLFKMRVFLYVLLVLATGAFCYGHLHLGLMGWFLLVETLGLFLLLLASLGLSYYGFFKMVCLVQLLALGLVGYMGYQDVNLYQSSKLVQDNIKTTSYKLKILTLSESAIATVPQLTDSVLVPRGVDSDYIDALKKDVLANAKVTLSTQEVDSYATAYQDLMDRKARAIVMNASQEGLLAQAHPNYYKSVKSIYDFSASMANSLDLTQASAKEGSLLLQLTNNSDSIKDNAFANSLFLYTRANAKDKPNRQVLDVNSQVTLKGDDQLTVSLKLAGLYGMNTLLQAVADQVQSPINHLAVIDYSKLIKLLQYLPALTVVNETAFYSSYNNTTFEAGSLYLDKDQLQIFGNERAEGYETRQGAVVLAIIKALKEQGNLLEKREVQAILDQSIKSDLSLLELMNWLDA